MLGWTYAYFRFPPAIDAILVGLNPGPFKRHLVGVKNFVEFCGHSHWVMSVCDVTMVAMMYLHSPAWYYLGVATGLGALVPLYLGARYSIRVIEALRNDAGSINRFIVAVRNGRSVEVGT